MFQNILFYYDYASCNKPSGVILLEGSYCSKLDFSSGTSKVTGKIHPENEVNMKCILIKNKLNKIRNAFYILSTETILLTVCDFFSIVSSFRTIILKCDNTSSVRPQKRHVRLGWTLWNKPGKATYWMTLGIRVMCTTTIISIVLLYAFNVIMLIKKSSLCQFQQTVVAKRRTRTTSFAFTTSRREWNDGQTALHPTVRRTDDGNKKTPRRSTYSNILYNFFFFFCNSLNSLH